MDGPVMMSERNRQLPETPASKLQASVASTG